MNKIKVITITLTLVSVMYAGSAFAQENEVHTYKDLNASSQTVYFNLEKGMLVNITDTASTGYDISFQRTKLELSSTASGQLLSNSNFTELNAAPPSGYLAGKAAIPQGSGKSWYAYNMENHLVTAIPGKVLLIHTQAGKYIKLVIDSYYQQGADRPSGYYTFRYAVVPASN